MRINRSDRLPLRRLSLLDQGSCQLRRSMCDRQDTA
jgi:hypothetical protein